MDGKTHHSGEVVFFAAVLPKLVLPSSVSPCVFCFAGSSEYIHLKKVICHSIDMGIADTLDCSCPPSIL